MSPDTAPPETRPSRMVLAGAGTGKTHLLAEHYLELLNALSPLDVVAVTFTERAAAELRARIRARARAARLPAGVIAQLDAAPIGTMHALAARVCRDHPVQAGVPQSFTVMDGLRSRQWRAARLPPALQVTRPDVLSHLPYSRVVNILNVLLDDPHETLRRLDAAPAATTVQWQTLLDAARLSAWQQLTMRPRWLAAQTTVTGLQGAPGDRLEELRTQVAHTLLTPDHPVHLAADVIASAKLNVGSKKAWNGDDLRLVKEAIEALRDLVRGEPLLTLALNSQDDALITALPMMEAAFRAVHAQLYAWRIQQGELDFADLEGRAVAALRDPQVRAHYHSRFKALLVDECQDTSPAQLELLRGVAGDAVTTFVGDPLQAIYGFRTGPLPMHDVLSSDVLRRGGQVQQLAHSYRAHQGLIQPLNMALRHLTGGRHQTLTAGRAPPDDTAPLTFVEVEGDGGREGLLMLEARAVAREIKSLIDAGTVVSTADPTGTRPIQPEDIALLSRTWKSLDTFQRALLDAGIPAFQAGGGDLLATQEAQDAWTLLRAAGNAADDLATAAVLRGPLFGLQATHLHALWDSRLEQESWQAAIQRSRRSEHARARRFFEELRTLRQAAPLDTLLLADRFGYRAQLLGRRDGARRVADWDALLQLVVGLEAECPTPRSAAHRLRRLQVEQIRLPRPPIVVPDAVTLSSVHQAKGLEWPVVFIVDLAGTPRPDTTAAHVTEAGLVFSPDPFEKAKPAMLEYARRNRKLADEVELGQVLYVAATRVRDLLYASGPADSRSPAFTRLQESFSAAGAVFKRPVQETTHDDPH